MIEFVFVALPLVIAGVAVAIICAGLNNNNSKEKEKNMEKYIAVGAGLGLIANGMLQFSNIWDNPLGFATGPLVGMAIATIISNRNDRSEKHGFND